jgi:hypothetical protein
MFITTCPTEKCCKSESCNVNKTGAHPNDIISLRIIRKLKVKFRVLTKYLFEIHRFFSLKIVIKLLFVASAHKILGLC